jgi:ubiquinone/menaquinone biosynthesis C-methylase UbiE
MTPLFSLLETVPGSNEPLEMERADVETSSDRYSSRFPGEIGQHFLEVQARAALELLAPWPGARVLEVGGGHAQLAPRLLASGYQVTVAGSDEVCRARLDRVLAPGSFEFRACDLLDLPFPDRSFDVVLAFRLMAHVARWRELLAGMCRVAHRAVIVDYSDSRSFNRFYRSFFKWKRAFEGASTRTFLTFEPREIPDEMARHGFGRPVVLRQFFVPMVVHRVMGRAGLSRAIERGTASLGLTRRFGSPTVLRVERLLPGEGR